MSTFDNPTHFFVFEMDNGKRKLAYGTSPEDAIGILRMRLTDEEMSHIHLDRYEKIPQRQMRRFIDQLG